MLERLDRNVGTLLDRLEDPNGDGSKADSIRDETIILFTSDNGGLLQDNVTSNRPLRAGKGSLYEGGIREPMIVSWTGNPALPSARNNAGRVSEALFTGYDIAPTLLDLANVSQAVTVNSRNDGVSVVDALLDQPFDRGDIFWHYPHHSPRSTGPAPVAGGDFVSAVRRGQWKLMWFYDEQRYELYDLANDVGESKERPHQPSGYRRESQSCSPRLPDRCPGPVTTAESYGETHRSAEYCDAVAPYSRRIPRSV